MTEEKNNNSIDLQDWDTVELLRRSSNFPFITLLNSNRSEQLFTDPYAQFDRLFAAGNTRLNFKPFFPGLKDFLLHNSDQWLFGYLGYDLKNELEELSSANQDTQKSDDHFLFKPDILISEQNGRTELKGNLNDLLPLGTIPAEEAVNKPKPKAILKSRVKREEYIQNVESIKNHIRRGDIYEMNYCIEFFAEDYEADPVELYQKLNQLSPMPFSAFLKNNDQYVICASPERFIARRGNKIISQPIKGTAKRGANEDEDQNIIKDLYTSEKERSENVMIVDLVRNDLSRTAVKGSVSVEELFGIKTFRRLHQMISTVVSKVENDRSSADVIAAAFPMGSMTGAPKVRAMQLIEQYESSKRGIYSGSIGYFSPDSGFDFNVVIRSIFYNARTKLLSFMVGSAITINADPSAEYEECLLKASAMMEIIRS